MIKTSIIEKQEVHEKQSYPYIGINKANGIVVLFTNRNKGHCLNNECNVFELLGNYTEDYFKPFHGSITLTQE